LHTNTWHYNPLYNDTRHNDDGMCALGKMTFGESTLSITTSA
jgi:hypothetical protein